MDKTKIEQFIREYNWRKSEIARLESAQDSTEYPGGGGFETLGVRGYKIYKRWREYEESVSEVLSYYDLLVKDKHIVIFDCMIDGMDYNSIAKHLGVSRQTLRLMRDEMLNHIFMKKYCESLTNA